jgi:hypothetical protein
MKCGSSGLLIALWHMNERNKTIFNTTKAILIALIYGSNLPSTVSINKEIRRDERNGKGGMRQKRANLL